jgi:hypothetical protein
MQVGIPAANTSAAIAAIHSFKITTKESTKRELSRQQCHLEQHGGTKRIEKKL